jgi:hypothetical protein
VVGRILTELGPSAKPDSITELIETSPYAPDDGNGSSSRNVACVKYIPEDGKFVRLVVSFSVKG